MGERAVRNRGASVVTRLVACAALLIPMVVVSQSKAEAASGQCLSAQFTYAGFGHYSRLPANWHETPEGVSAYIRNQLGAICSTYPYPSSYSTAWVMLNDKNNGLRYSQSGYIRDGGCNYVFAEVSNGGGGFSRVVAYYLGCLTSGQQLQYQVKWVGAAGQNGSGHLENWANGIAIQVTGVNFWNSAWSNEVSYFGEVVYPTSDVPGVVGAIANYDSMQIQSVDTGGWTLTPCYLSGPNTTSVRYKRAGFNCNTTAIWTDPL